MSAPISNQHFTLFLSSEGDTVEILNLTAQGNPKQSIPEQLEATSCKTHQEVLAFLEKINTSELRNSLHFFHSHNTSYKEHLGSWPKGQAHNCPLDKLISFVSYKIGESEHGVRQPPRKLCIIM